MSDTERKNAGPFFIVPQPGLDASIQRPGMREDIPSFATLTTEGLETVSKLMMSLLLQMDVPENELPEIMTIVGEDDNTTRPMDLSRPDDFEHIIAACQRLQVGKSIGFYLRGNPSTGDIGKLNYKLQNDPTIQKPLTIAINETDGGLLLIITCETPEEHEARLLQEKQSQ